MSRYGKVMSEDDFINLFKSWTIKSLKDDDERGELEEILREPLSQYASNPLMSRLETVLGYGLNACLYDKDLKKVHFDFENYGLGDTGNSDTMNLRTLTCGIPVLLAWAGGDWEAPVSFAIYPDATSGLRAYIPKDGNTYHHKARTAYGNGDDGEAWQYAEDAPEADINLLFADIELRVTVKP